MRQLIIYLLLCLTTSSYADNVMRFTTSSSADAFPEVINIFSELYSRLGYRIEITKLPNRRALYEASNRDWVDGELARVKDAEHLLSSHIRIPVPVAKIAASAFVRELSIKVKDWEELRPYKLGSLRGIIAIEKRLIGFNTQEASSPSQLLDMLDRKRIQIAVMPRPMGEFALKALPYNVLILEPPIEEFNLYHYVNQKHRSLVPQLTAILSELTGEQVEIRP